MHARLLNCYSTYVQLFLPPLDRIPGGLLEKMLYIVRLKTASTIG
jgi:hypothetical protein